MFSLVPLLFGVASFGAMPFDNADAFPPGRGPREAALMPPRPPEPPQPPRSRQGPGDGPPRIKALFERIDRNGDGVLDLREFTQAARRLIAMRQAGPREMPMGAMRGPFGDMRAPMGEMRGPMGPGRRGFGMQCPCCRGPMGGPDGAPGPMPGRGGPGFGRMPRERGFGGMQPGMGPAPMMRRRGPAGPQSGFAPNPAFDERLERLIDKRIEAALRRAHGDDGPPPAMHRQDGPGRDGPPAQPRGDRRELRRRDRQQAPDGDRPGRRMPPRDEETDDRDD